MKYEVIKWPKGGGEDIRIVRTEMPTETGELAIRLATHFAIIAAQEDGEDKAGRQKLRLQSADEVVARSCDIAEKLTAEMRNRGWILDLPIPAAPEPPVEDEPEQPAK